MPGWTKIKHTGYCAHGRIKAWEIFQISQAFSVKIREGDVVKMQWIFLLIAGLFEVVWAVGLKMSENFSKFVPGAVTIVGLIASMYFLSLSLKELPIGTAYAIWTGIGTAGTLIFSIVWFREAITLPQVLCVMMIIGGVVGLKVLSPS